MSSSCLYKVRNSSCLLCHCCMRALAALICARIWLHLSFAWRTRYSCLSFGCLDSTYPAHTEDTSIYGHQCRIVAIKVLMYVVSQKSIQTILLAQLPVSCTHLPFARLVRCSAHGCSFATLRHIYVALTNLMHINNSWWFDLVFDFYLGMPHMHRSRIELEYYSVTYTEHITNLDIYESCMTFSGSSVLRDRIIFEFYPWLSHMYTIMHGLWFIPNAASIFVVEGRVDFPSPGQSRWPSPLW